MTPRASPPRAPARARQESYRWQQLRRRAQRAGAKVPPSSSVLRFARATNPASGLCLENAHGALSPRGQMECRPMSLVLRRGLAVAVATLSLAAMSSCGANVTPAGLPPTLGFQLVDGGRVAMQSGQPVPDFGYQPRPRVDLTKDWRFQRANLDADLTFTPRTESLKAIEREAAGRQLPGLDDGQWQPID